MCDYRDLRTFPKIGDYERKKCDFLGMSVVFRDNSV